MKSITTLYLLLLLGLFSQLHAQTPPCYGNPQATGGVCIGDTFQMNSYAFNCTTCTYSWSSYGGTLVGGGGPSDNYARYVFNHPATQPNDYGSVSCNYTDTAGTFCQGGYTFEQTDLTIFGQLQLGVPMLLNGPYDGDTSKTWIYNRANGFWSSQNDYSTRSYTIVGGTLDSAFVGMGYGGYPDDTLYIRWNNTANRQINCSAPYLTTMQTLGNSWPYTCYNYVETIPPEQLHDPFPVGQDSVCPGDTIIYYTTPVTGATHSWSATGGTILSGQNTEVVEVLWTGIPMSLTVTRTLGGNSVSQTKNVSAYQVNPLTDLLPSDTNYCVGTPLVLDAGPAPNWTWNTAATTQSITVNDSGTYIVTVTDTFCGSPFTISDTVVVERHIPIKPDLGPDRTFCQDTAQVFTLLPSDGFDEVYWGSASVHNPTASFSFNGDLRVTTIDTNGCQARDTVTLNAIWPPYPGLSAQYSFCDGDSVFLNTFQTTAQLNWSTGDTTPAIYVKTPGQVSVIASENGCVQYDTALVNQVFPPVVNLGVDTSICSGDSLLLTIGNANGNPFWSTGQFGLDSIYVTQADTYDVQVYLYPCLSEDTIIVQHLPTPVVQLGNDSVFCSGDSILLDAGNPGATYAWTNGASSQTTYFSQAGPIAVTVTDPNSCAVTEMMTLVEDTSCVWPGDLDDDGIADNNDVLALGAALNQNGPLRNGASLNWIGQEASDWANTQANNANVKHCDSDGNGTTNQDDTLAITLNFGLTHSKTGGTATGIPVFLVPENDSVTPGDIAYFSLELGDAQNPVGFAYGLAFSLEFDSSLVTPAGLHSVEYSNSWLGNQLLTFTYEHSTISRADLAVSRTNQVDTSGFGSIARIGFVTKMGASASANLQIGLSNVRLVNHDLLVENTSPQGASVVVTTAATGLDDGWAALPTLQIHPNPAQDRVQISLQGHPISAWELYDVNGALKERAMVDRLAQFRIETEDLPNGIYFVRVHDEAGRSRVGKLQIMR